MLFQPTNIVPDEVSGAGCVDIQNDLVISWQVNGDSALSAYKITIFTNDSASTQLYTTGRISLSEAHWGRNADGEIDRMEVTILASALSTAGLTNGKEYKFTIEQWWNVNSSITQLTASIFKTRGTPTVAIDTIDNPVEGKAYTFTGTFNQAQGDPINTIRWYLAYKDAEGVRKTIFDSKAITGTGLLSMTYDGLVNDADYSVRLVVTSINDAEADTGWVDFRVHYSVEEPGGSATACQLARMNCVSVKWDRLESTYGYSIMRQEVGNTLLEKISDVGQNVGQIRDYSAKSGKTYVYYVYPVGQVQFLTAPMITNPVSVQYNAYAIIEAEAISNRLYHVIAAHYFRYGNNGLVEGEISNNNSPSLLQNFTPYPFRQGSTANYKTGSVAGYIGSVNFSNYEYSDTAEMTDEIMKLSTSQNTLFLTDLKGHFIMVHTNGSISAQTDINKKPMPQTVTVPWVEIGDTEGIALTASPENSFYPLDNIRFTSLFVDAQSGTLYWVTPDDYNEGSVLSLNSSGILIQDSEGSYTPADMEFDPDTGIVTATI